VGRLSKEKGHSDLLAAFAMAAEAATAPLLLLIAGEGPERRKLEAIASRVNGRVHFLGHVEDPWLLYHAADIFVLPSHSEGSPLVVLEAMAAQLPIVATSVGGVPELLKDGLAGILTAPHDPVRFAENIILLANNPNLRITLASKAKAALGEHAPRAYAERLLRLYDRARSC
jgi:glycosyltransferase involved in cell wall biosynthesis